MKTAQYLFVMFALCLCLFAQEKSQSEKVESKQPAGTPAAAGHMVKPSPEMEKLTKTFLGTWTTSEKMEPNPMSPAGSNGKGTAVFKPGPGGLSLIEEYRSANATGQFAGHGVFWWDERAAGYKGVWCDSMSAVCEAGHGLAKWEGTNLVDKSETEMNGAKLVTQVTYSDITPNSFTMTMAGSPPESEPKLWMTIQYTRAGNASKPAAMKTKKKEQ